MSPTARRPRPPSLALSPGAGTAKKDKVPAGCGQRERYNPSAGWNGTRPILSSTRLLPKSGSEWERGRRSAYSLEASRRQIKRGKLIQSKRGACNPTARIPVQAERGRQRILAARGGRIPSQNRDLRVLSAFPVPRLHSRKSGAFTLSGFVSWLVLGMIGS